MTTPDRETEPAKFKAQDRAFELANQIRCIFFDPRFRDVAPDSSQEAIEERFGKPALAGKARFVAGAIMDLEVVGRLFAEDDSRITESIMPGVILETTVDYETPLHIQVGQIINTLHSMLPSRDDAAAEHAVTVVQHR